MQETSNDMMEDTMSEDNMMDCGVDAEGMDELEDLTTEIPDSTATIRDAAERLLTLLGVDELGDDFLSSSSSEDEGVEVDLDDNEDDEDDDDDDDDETGPTNIRLLHQLAASLAEELKYSKIKSNNITTKNNTQCNRITVGTIVDGNSEQIQRMDVAYSDDGHQIINEQSSMLGNKFDTNYCHYQYDNNSKQHQEINYRSCDNQKNHSRDRDDFFVSNKRCRIENDDRTTENCEIPSLWKIGWDTCAAEAVKYLIDVEGLDSTHPTVLALKNHLEIQRSRAFLQYTT